MERETGIEPATSSLGSWHSTAELLPLTGYYSIIGEVLERKGFARCGLAAIERGFFGLSGVRSWSVLPLAQRLLSVSTLFIG